MLSLTPGMPGRRQQTPRTIMSIRTPARDAPYSTRIISGSATELFLTMMRAGRPASAWAASRSTSSVNLARRLRGATSSSL